VLLGVKEGQAVEPTSPVLEQEIRGQGVFVSTFTHSLDPKKRLTIPSEWRAQVGTPESLYVVPDVNLKCLFVFPAAEMARRLVRIQQYSITDPTARQFARVLASQSDLLAWDSQGRIRIKDELLAFAGLTDQVVLVGAFNMFELWNPDRLRQEGALDRANLQDAARYVGF
jgi:MraZ protein